LKSNLLTKLKKEIFQYNLEVFNIWTVVPPVQFSPSFQVIKYLLAGKLY